MSCTGSESVECRELLRRMAANLAHRAGKTSPPKLDAVRGDMGVFVRGVFRRFEPCDDPGSITPEDFETRMFDFFGCGRDVYVIALTYLDRLFQKNPDFAICNGDVNCWLLASITLAIKWREEVCDSYPDEHYAIVGGLTLEEFCLLELQLLVLLGWELHVDPFDFCKHCFLTAALRTKATQCSNASTCSPLDSEDEEAKEEDAEDAEEVWSDNSDDGEGLPGRPLWAAHSFKTHANDVQHGEEAGQEEDEGLPGWVQWIGLVWFRLLWLIGCVFACVCVFVRSPVGLFVWFVCLCWFVCLLLCVSRTSRTKTGCAAGIRGVNKVWRKRWRMDCPVGLRGANSEHSF